MDHPDMHTRDLSSLGGMLGRPQVRALVRRIESTLGVDFTIVYGQTGARPR
jgi:hypothetical protein